MSSTPTETDPDATFYENGEWYERLQAATVGFDDDHSAAHDVEPLGRVAGSGSPLFPRFPDLDVSYCHDCNAYTVIDRWD